MVDIYKKMIKGACEGAEKLAVNSPYDGKLLAEVETATADDIEKALHNASAFFSNRDNWLPADRRIDILGRVMHIMSERAQELAITAASEGGKPLVDSKVEVARAIDGIKILIETIRTSAGREIPMGLNAASKNRLAFTHKEPIGVVVAISAFNHPLNLIVHQVGPAIAVGAPCIVKPSNDTPISCLKFVQILREAGLPEEMCQVAVITDRSLATKLATDERVSFFSFIGSAGVGWKLRSQLAPGTRCALEHGGVAPVIVTESADFDDAVALIAKAGFYHAGQVCVSAQRVFVHDSIAGKFAIALAEAGQKMKVGDPTDEKTDIGPIIRHKETDRIDTWVKESLDEGAKLLCGGKKISDSLYPATVLLDPPAEAKVSRQEIFGPVVCVYSYNDLDQAIKEANSLPFAFQAGVFTKDLDVAMTCYDRLDASAVMVNDHTAFRVDWMPFAGLKHSGYGTGGMPYTMDDMQVEKMIVIRST
jgi:acyl-CoA reductase-like NAD-dependent aldehyde dehydrogenase